MHIGKNLTHDVCSLPQRVRAKVGENRVMLARPGHILNFAPLFHAHKFIDPLLETRQLAPPV